MTREELDFIGAMNMHDEISNEAYKKIACHFEGQESKTDRLYGWLNDMRLGFAPDETTPQGERAKRLAQVEVIDDIMEWLEKNGQEPKTDGDCISRQETIDAMYALCDTEETLKENPWRDNPHIDAIIDALDNLQPVNPQEPKADDRVKTELNRVKNELKQEPILDKIRAEIADLDDTDYDYEGYYKAVTDALRVIDKYRQEG